MCDRENCDFLFRSHEKKKNRKKKAENNFLSWWKNVTHRARWLVSRLCGCSLWRHGATITSPIKHEKNRIWWSTKEKTWESLSINFESAAFAAGNGATRKMITILMWQGKLDESVYFWLIGVFDYSAVPFQREPVIMHSFCLKTVLKNLVKFRCNAKFEEENKKLTQILTIFGTFLAYYVTIFWFLIGLGP